MRSPLTPTRDAFLDVCCSPYRFGASTHQCFLFALSLFAGFGSLCLLCMPVGEGNEEMMIRAMKETTASSTPSHLFTSALMHSFTHSLIHTLTQTLSRSVTECISYAVRVHQRPRVYQHQILCRDKPTPLSRPMHNLLALLYLFLLQQQGARSCRRRGFLCVR